VRKGGVQIRLRSEMLSVERMNKATAAAERRNAGGESW
jgi:hypothetical protein